MEVVAVYEGLGDVEAQRGVSLGDHEIEVVRNEEGIDGEDGDLVAEDVGEGAVRAGSVKGERERGERKEKYQRK